MRLLKLDTIFLKYKPNMQAAVKLAKYILGCEQYKMQPQRKEKCQVISLVIEALGKQTYLKLQSRSMKFKYLFSC